MSSMDNSRESIARIVGERFASGPEGAISVSVSGLLSAATASMVPASGFDRGDFVAAVTGDLIKASMLPASDLAEIVGDAVTPGAAVMAACDAIIEAVAVAMSVVHAAHCPEHGGEPVDFDHCPAAMLQDLAGRLDVSHGEPFSTNAGRTIAEWVTETAAAVREASGAVAKLADLDGFVADIDAQGLADMFDLEIGDDVSYDD